MGEKKNTYRILMGNPEVKRPLKRHRLRWENNIKMELREIVWGVMDWIHLAQDRDETTLGEDLPIFSICWAHSDKDVFPVLN
jgi:hypothetical protein